MPNKLNTISISFILLLVTSTMVSADTLLPKVRETLLGRIPKGYEIIPASIKMSHNVQSIVFAAYSDNTHKIIQINNQTSPVYYSLQPGMPIWSPDSEKCAYIAYKNKSEAVVVINDTVIANVDNADNFIFSSLGSRYACRAQKNNRQFVIVDGKPGKPYDGILIKDNFTFSPDNKRFFYVAQKDGACVAVVDGQEEPQSFNLIENVRFSPNSSHYAYKARTEKGTLGKGKWCVVRDGQAGEVYDTIFDLIFSHDSKHLAYAAIKNKRMMIVFDGHEMAPHDMVGLPLFSYDSKTFVHAVTDNKKWQIMLNDQKSTSFDQVFKFYFSLDSSQYAFIALDNDEWACVVNGKKELPFTQIGPFEFSLDSARYMYSGVDKNGVRVIIDGKPGQIYRSVGDAYFSPDSKHVVYRAIRPDEDQWITVFDGKESSKKYIGIGKYRFSLHSKHLVFPAAISINQSVMVVDGIEQCSDKNFKIIGDPEFSPFDDYIVYHARAAEGKWQLIVNGHVLPETYGGFFKGAPIVFDSPNHFYTQAINSGGTEFVLIDVEIPETLKLTSGLNQL